MLPGEYVWYLAIENTQESQRHTVELGEVVGVLKAAIYQTLNSLVDSPSCYAEMRERW